MIQFLNGSSLILECLGSVFITIPKLRQAGRLVIAAANGWFAVMLFLAHIPGDWLDLVNAAACGFCLGLWWRARAAAMAVTR